MRKFILILLVLTSITALSQNYELWGWGANEYGQLGDSTTINKVLPTRIGTEYDWKMISVGNYVSLAIKKDGSLWAWGDNTYGQLGDGSANNKLFPQRIGVDNDWKSISVGSNFVLAIKTDGSLWGWGSNENGQLGLGNVLIVSNPQQIGDEKDWSQVFAGNTHSVILKNDSLTIYTMGENNTSYYKITNYNPTTGATTQKIGTLGIGVVNNNKIKLLTKIITSFSAKVIKIIAGNLKTLVLLDNGETYACGAYRIWHTIAGSYTYNEFLQPLGNVKNLINLTTSDDHFVAIKEDGSLKSWGNNINGQLGTGNYVQYDTPQDIGKSSDKWLAITTNFQNTFGVMQNGSLWAWGNNQVLTLGDSNKNIRNRPTRVGFENDWKEVVSGKNHALALKLSPIQTYDISGKILDEKSNPIATSFTLHLSGSSSATTTSSTTDGSFVFSDLLNGTYIITPTPTSSYTFSPASRTVKINSANVLSGVDFTAVAIINTQDTTGYELWGWGDNSNKQLNNNMTSVYNSPLQIDQKEEWIQVQAGLGFSIALKKDGTLWAWGLNPNGELGIGNNQNTNIPKQIGNENNWKFISIGATHSLAIKNNGTLWAWGFNRGGCLGDGTILNRNLPVQIGSDNDWILCDASEANLPNESHSLALKSDGSLWSWGYNLKGQLGNGNKVNSYAPTKINFNKKCINFSTGADFSLAILEDSTLWSWGGNTYGQLGNGTNIESLLPINISTNEKWANLSAGKYFSIAKTYDGRIFTCGFNGNGQLGDGTTNNNSIYKQVGTKQNWKIIEAGGDNCHAIDNNFEMWAWGYNGTGVLGTINNLNTRVPFKLIGKWHKISNGSYHKLALKINTYELSGKILDTNSKPITSSFVVLISGNSTTSTNTSLTDGLYKFPDLAKGTYVITPTPTSSYTFSPASRTVTVNSANITSGVDFTGVERKFKLSGYIKENGIPLANHKVYLTKGSEVDSTATLGDGKYSFSKLTGVYRITVDTTIKLSQPLSYENINLTKDTIGFNFDIYDKSIPTFQVYGKVIDLDNNADIPGVEIILSGTKSNTFTTNATGEYSFNLPNGNYELQAVKSGFTFTPTASSFTINNNSATYNFSGIADKYNITGYVRDNAGANISNHLMTLSNGSSTITDANGYYLFKVRSGSYVIKADNTVYKPSPDSIVVNISNANIDNNDFILTAPTATYNISGMVVDNTGITLEKIDVLLASKIVQTDSQGKFIFPNIATGEHVIIPSSSEYYFEPTYTRVTLNKDISDLKFTAIKLTDLPSCLVAKDTVLPSVYVFDPYLASKRGFIEIKNDCSENYVISDIILSSNTTQFKIVGMNDMLPLTIPIYSSVNIPIEFKPSMAGDDSVYVRFIINNKNLTAKVKSSGVDAGPELPYTVLTMRTNPEKVVSGERVELYLLVPKRNNYSLTTNDTYETMFSIKTQLVADLDTINTPNIIKFNNDGQTGIVGRPGKYNPNGQTRVRFQGRYIPTLGDTLAKFQFIATLGQQDSTNIEINDFRWLSGGAKAEIFNDGIFRIMPCEAGGERLITWQRAQNSAFIQALAPNPVGDELKLLVETTKEKDIANIQIFSIIGNEVFAKSNISLTKGINEVALILNNLQTGTYRLTLNNEQYILFIKE